MSRGARDLFEAADSLRGDMGDEYVSVEGATRDYSVVLTGSLDDLTLAIDKDATIALRAGKQPPAPPRANPAETIPQRPA